MSAQFKSAEQSDVTELGGDSPFSIGDRVACYRPPVKSPESFGTVIGGSPVCPEWVRVRPDGKQSHFAWHKHNLRRIYPANQQKP